MISGLGRIRTEDEKPWQGLTPSADKLTLGVLKVCFPLRLLERESAESCLDFLDGSD